MKIDARVSNYMALLQCEAPLTAARTERLTDSPRPSAASPVVVDLSPDASQLADDEARRERLNIIRQQLAEGSYNISGKDVADKMLNILKG